AGPAPPGVERSLLRGVLEVRPGEPPPPPGASRGAGAAARAQPAGPRPGPSPGVEDHHSGDREIEPHGLPADGGPHARQAQLREPGRPGPPDAGAARKGGRGVIRIDLQGESLVLLPERALLWERTATLIVADAH